MYNKSKNNSNNNKKILVPEDGKCGIFVPLPFTKATVCLSDSFYAVPVLNISHVTR
jgi:hypothetical protein